MKQNIERLRLDAGYFFKISGDSFDQLVFLFFTLSAILYLLKFRLAAITGFSSRQLAGVYKSSYRNAVIMQRCVRLGSTDIGCATGKRR